MAGGGGRGEENKNRLYINDFALSLVLKLRLGAAWKWSFVLRVIGDILWTSCFESYGPKKLVKRGWSYKLRITVFVLNYY